MKPLLILLLCLFSHQIYAQNNYLPPQREGVSDASYEKWVNRIQSFRKRLENKDISTKARIVLEYNIAHGYKVLKEPSDSLFDRLSNLISLDTTSVCYEIIDWNRAFKGFGQQSYEELSPQRWQVLYKLCLPYAQNLEKEHEKSRIVEEKNIDPILLKRLNFLIERDKKYRDSIGLAERKYGIHSAEVKTLWQKQHELDALNAILIDSIITQYNGYIGTKITGESHSNDLLLVALHSNSLDFLNKHYPMFVKLVKENEINKELFAILTDRYHLQKDGMQVFGTQQKWNKEKQISEKAPMYPEEKLTQLKKGLGF